MELRGAWNELMRRLGVEEHATLCDEVLAHYEEPQRHYHTLNHLRACVKQWREFEGQLDDAEAVLLALFYHDVIYDVHRFDNEEMSAELFRRHAVILKLDSVLIERVVGMILATKSHQTHDLDTQVLLDIDLSILGEARQVFDQFERDIRAEYFWVTEALFRQKRAQILHDFLARERIYHSVVLHDRLESQARRNLSRRVRELET